MTSKAPKGRFFARVSANIRCPTFFADLFVDAFVENDTLALDTCKKRGFVFSPVVLGNIHVPFFREFLRTFQLIFVFATFSRYFSAHLHIFTMKNVMFLALCT